MRCAKVLQAISTAMAMGSSWVLGGSGPMPRPASVWWVAAVAFAQLGRVR